MANGKRIGAECLTYTPNFLLCRVADGEDYGVECADEHDEFGEQLCGAEVGWYLSRPKHIEVAGERYEQPENEIARGKRM